MNRRLIFAVLALLCAGAVSAQERTEAPAASSEVRYVGRTQTNGGDVSLVFHIRAFCIPNSIKRTSTRPPHFISVSDFNNRMSPVIYGIYRIAL